MEIGIIIGVIAVALIALLFASYIKAPTDKALIVSGLRKNPCSDPVHKCLPLSFSGSQTAAPCPSFQVFQKEPPHHRC